MDTVEWNPHTCLAVVVLNPDLNIGGQISSATSRLSFLPSVKLRSSRQVRYQLVRVNGDCCA